MMYYYIVQLVWSVLFNITVVICYSDDTTNTIASTYGVDNNVS